MGSRSVAPRSTVIGIMKSETSTASDFPAGTVSMPVS
jgi:hypothetical protein